MLVTLSGKHSACLGYRHGAERPPIDLYCSEPSSVSTQSAELARGIRLSERRIYLRSRLGCLPVASVSGNEVYLASFYSSQTFPTSPCTFRPAKTPCYESYKLNRSDPDKISDEIVVFDTLSETLPGEGGMITCVQWLSWETESELHHQITIPSRSAHAIGAIIIAPTGEGSNVYRRIGWLEVFDASFFDSESKDILFV